MATAMSDRELLAAVGRRVTVARQNAGLHPPAFARKAGVSLSTVYAWERGAVDMGIPGLVRVAGLLGVTASHLLGEGDGP
jgi:transcriptional regulator with XRE-family HTH domain